MYETLRFDVEESVGWVRLVRPQKLNAISPQMVRELRAVVDAVRADRSIRVRAFTGTGRAFSAGADLSELVGLARPPRFPRFRAARQRVFGAIEALDR